MDTAIMMMVSRTILYTCGHVRQGCYSATLTRNWERKDGVTIAPSECYSCNARATVRRARAIHEARVQAALAADKSS